MRHLGEAGALAAEQVAHVGAALRLAAAEGVDPFPLFPLAAVFDGAALAAASADRDFPGFRRVQCEPRFSWIFSQADGRFLSAI